jgi:hypothetical protein
MWGITPCFSTSLAGDEKLCDASRQQKFPPANNFWAVTENSATNAWNVNLSNGNTNNNNKATNSNYVRCVRQWGILFCPNQQASTFALRATVDKEA